MSTVSELTQAAHCLMGWTPERQPDGQVLWRCGEVVLPFVEAIDYVERQEGKDYWLIYMDYQYQVWWNNREERELW